MGSADGRVRPVGFRVRRKAGKKLSMRAMKLPESQPPAQPQATGSSKRDAVNAVVASFLGWSLDAFDFFVLVFAMPEIANDFHKDIPDVAKTIAVTLAFRPVGAFIFGLIADRYGRR